MSSDTAALNGPAPETVAAVQAAMRAAQQGDIAEARRIGETALAAGRDAALLQGFVGMLCCRMNDLDAGIRHLHAAHAATPDDLSVAGNLATALLDMGQFADAAQVLTAERAARDPSLRLMRLRAYALQASGAFMDAVAAYRAITAAQPTDYEAWNNCGNALAGAGDHDAAIAAIAEAVRLRPDVAPTRLNLGVAQLHAGRTDEALATLEALSRDFPDDEKSLLERAAILKQLGRDEDALALLEQAAALVPDDADLAIKLALERQYAWRMDEAEAALKHALALRPDDAEAHLFLALHYEYCNQPQALAELFGQAQARGMAAGTLDFMQALVLRREQRFAEGLAAIERVPDSIEPIRRAQLRGQFLDRLGDSAGAFAAFAEMNRLQQQDDSDPVGRAAQYRAHLDADHALLTPEWLASWTEHDLPEPEFTPVFLLGFPRSGTTLLDTMLMGHPGVKVMEERPPISRVERALGGMARLPNLTANELTALRAIYFEEMRQWIDPAPGDLVVDKFPLHLNKVPIIRRLFPKARFVLALRHPCDVVLSCFITNFRINNAMANFLDLEGTAHVYDRSFAFWQQCRDLMQLDVHDVRYEAMVADKESVLRPLFAALGLDWHDDVLDHRQTAAARGIISTASYAQVHEPIYDRAAGRWTRYAEQLAPVMPILNPWIARHGYEC